MKIHDVDQNTEEWYSLRCGKPTASGFDQIITNTGKRSKQWEGWANELAGELLAGEPVDAWQGNANTERGHELEDHAVSLYEFANDVECERVGFITDDDELCGCSPDRLVGDDGMLEIKCPKNREHIGSIVHIKQHGTCPPGYYQQVQGQLWITGREWCALQFYHPNLPSENVTIYPDKDVFAIYDEMLPKIIARRDDVLKQLMDM